MRDGDPSRESCLTLFYSAYTDVLVSFSALFLWEERIEFSPTRISTHNIRHGICVAKKHATVTATHIFSDRIEGHQNFHDMVAKLSINQFYKKFIFIRI